MKEWLNGLWSNKLLSLINSQTKFGHGGDAGLFWLKQVLPPVHISHNPLFLGA